MARDEGSLALETEACSIESAEDEGGPCSCEGHLVDGLVGGEAQDGTDCAEDGIVAALKEVGAYVGGEDTHEVLEAADARYLEDTECCMRVAMGELGDDIQEAVMADCSILEVAGDVVSVIGGVPRTAEATFEAGPLLDGGGGKAPGGALVKRQVGRWASYDSYEHCTTVRAGGDQLPLVRVRPLVVATACALESARSKG